jgi:uncharacterized Zn finger protein
MDAFEFLVQGSAAEPYRVSFHRWSDGNLSAYCTCPAGENGMACKHRVRILRGILDGVVSENHADVTMVAAWLGGTDVEKALQSVEALEKEAERIKGALTAAKKMLAQCLLD